jgi:hypothetical protein
LGQSLLMGLLMVLQLLALGGVVSPLAGPCAQVLVGAVCCCWLGWLAWGPVEKGVTWWQLLHLRQFQHQQHQQLQQRVLPEHQQHHLQPSSRRHDVHQCVHLPQPQQRPCGIDSWSWA